MRGHTGRTLVAATLLLAGTATAAIEGWDLTSTDVRQAYFLGQRRGDDKLAKFLEDYVKRLPAPASGPNVAVIQVSTPYHQVVKRSWRRAAGYSSQQAQREYQANSDLLLVNVTVNLVPGDVAVLRELGFWQQFEVRLVQGGQAIYPRRVDGELIYLADDHGGYQQVIGFELFAEFSTRQVSRAPLRVEVFTHDKQTVAADFDLARLK
jgi:hypothetical protein